MSARYQNSEALLERALQVIPLGSQTFSKSLTQYPYGVSPYFITHGKGCRVWDADGNEYIDFINSLASITLGYNDPDVNTAVRTQLDNGVIFSLPHQLEIEVAERIVDMVPCAEMVRFGKNGSDATAGAIRVARAYTDRERVAVCGYHGWQDWYIGSTARCRGVPQSTRELTHTFTYNDPTSLDKLLRTYPGEFAAVILEPMNISEPQPDFLDSVARLTRQHGALLIFDETITGFRYANGGAQEHFGVTPDLATFGKGLANGYPISAVAGRREFMRQMEEIFFSFTFGGEALSLAASAATLDKVRHENVCLRLSSQGRKLLDGLNQRIVNHGVSNFVSTAGHPAWSFLILKDTPQANQWELKTLLLQEFFAHGILSLGTHNLSFAHGDADIARLFEVYDQVLPLLGAAANEGRIKELLRCKPLEPLFKLR